MLDRRLLLSFSDELQKIAYTPSIPMPAMEAVQAWNRHANLRRAAIGGGGALLGAALGAASAVKVQSPQWKQDQLLRDLGQMPEDVHKSRINRRIKGILAGAAAGAVLGGGAGAAYPTIEHDVLRKMQSGRSGVERTVHEMSDAFWRKSAPYMRQSGNEFAEGFMQSAAQRAPSIAREAAREATGEAVSEAGRKIRQGLLGA